MNPELLWYLPAEREAHLSNQIYSPLSGVLQLLAGHSLHRVIAILTTLPFPGSSDRQLRRYFEHTEAVETVFQYSEIAVNTFLGLLFSFLSLIFLSLLINFFFNIFI